MQSKNKSKIMIQKNNQTTKKTEEQLEGKNKQKEEATRKYRNEKQKGRKKEKNKRDTKKEKVKKEEAPKRLKINKGKHRRTNNKNAPFLGGGGNKFFLF